jgi:CelD/BcsL family acetyltransferase involved in cellulose biosynthesis
VVPGGLLGEASDAIVEAFLRGLRGALARREADVVVFRELRVGSALHRAVDTSGSILVRDAVARRTVHRELALPESGDAFLASLSKSTRDGVRRYRNKIERELGDRLVIRHFREVEQIDELMESLASVTATSWQRELETSFRDDDAHRQRIRVGLERGWFRACVVSVDGRPAAFWLAQGCGGRFVLGIPGFDPAFGEYRIGQYALVALIESLCEDSEASVLDFGYGDAEYKRRFGTSKWEDQTLMLFARRPRPLLVNALRTVLIGSTEVSRSLLTDLGFVGRLRAEWRRRLAAPKPRGDSGS